MDDWRERLRGVVAAWKLAPEEQAGIIEELEQHLEEELDEWSPKIGATAAHARVMAHVNDPALRDASVRARHRPAASVQFSRSRAPGVAGVLRDLRYGWRSLFASPSTTIMASIALALGIGLTTVMFSVIYGFLWRGLPYDQPERIAMVGEADERGVDQNMSVHDFFAFRDAQKSFETFGAWAVLTANLSGDGQPERVDGSRITAGALNVTRVKPVLGRSFRADDETPGGPLVVLLSYALWRDRYSSDSTVLGRAVRVNGQSATIVGVMPDGFNFPRRNKLWVPLRVNPAATPWGTGPRILAVGRLRSSVSLDQANAELAGISKQLEAQHVETEGKFRVNAVPFIRSMIRTQIFTLMYAMFAAVGLVFLVACINVANLLLARASHRAKEVAIRSALGASRLAIARQFLVESLVLSALSAALGALIAQAGVAIFRDATARAGDVPFWTDVRLHPQVFLFIALAAVAATLVSGLLPAMTAARTDITDVLKDQSLGSSSLRGGRLSRGLVVFELVLSSALLVVAALTTRGMMKLRAIEPGFATQGVLTGRVTLTPGDTAARAVFFAQLEAELARMPGATSTALTSNLVGTNWEGGAVAINGRTYARSRDYPRVRRLAVTPGFFETFDIRLLRGRAFGTEDRAGVPRVAIVNQRFVDEHFRNTDPVGQRIKLSPTDSASEWLTVVGVIPTLYAASLEDSWPAEVLTAFHQESQSSASIAIRTSGDPTAIAQPLRTLVATLDRDLPVYSLTTMSAALAQTTWPMRIFGGLFVVFGVAALALASIGLYAVLAFSVSRREREMGIRMALGAATGDVVRLVIKDGAIQLALGVSIGVALGILGAQAGRAALFGVAPGDPATLAVVIGTLALTGFAACAIPAMRATKADPVRSLRAD